jgi:hypothetical protein
MSTLAALRDLLRDKTKWPEGFRWNFGDFATCAIGLAQRAGLIEGVRPVDVEAADLGIDEMDYWQLFISSGPSPMTPERVAERLDAYLATQS